MNTKILVRPATADDIPELCRIESECFGDPWSKAAFTFCGEYYFAAQYHTDTESGCPDTAPICGYAAVLHTPDGEELLRIAADADKRRMGIGGALLDEIIRHCRKSRADTIRLEVRCSNEAAHALYISRGFREVGIRRRYYRRPPDDARLMELKL